MKQLSEVTSTRFGHARKLCWTKGLYWLVLICLYTAPEKLAGHDLARSAWVGHDPAGSEITGLEFGWYEPAGFESAEPELTKPELTEFKESEFGESRQATDTDTLQLTLRQAESLFLERNLELLAGHLEIDIHQARIRQARLWNDPEITLEHQIINREGSGPIGFRRTDNTVFEIEQVISTAGKRGRTIALRETEREQAEHRFDRILRDLQGSLREQMFELAYLNRKAGLYRRQIDSLERVLESFRELQSRGDVSRLETLRISGLLVELQSDYLEVRDEQRGRQHDLAIMLQLEDQTPVPLLPEDSGSRIQAERPLQREELLQAALSERPELRELDAGTRVARRQLNLERANAWPDVGIGLIHDRLDGVVDNYWGVSLNIRLPLFNRNQGGIEAAGHRIRQADYRLARERQEVASELLQVIDRFEDTRSLHRRIDPDYEKDFSILIDTLLDRYRDGEIRLIEFIDHYDAFRESMIHLWSVDRDLLLAAERLNRAAGREIIPLTF